jgi:small subunit ribosomal protein S17
MAKAEKKTTQAAAKVETPAVQVEGKARQKRVLVGMVVSDKMQKTIVVEVKRRVRHSLYKKYVTRSRRFKAHDEKNEARVGDVVTIIESRPLSRDKRWALQGVVRRGLQTIEVTA